MITIRIPWRRRRTQAAVPPTSVPPPDDHALQAARHLYESVRPADALTWRELTDGQRRRYTDLIRMAQRCCDLRAVAAAHESVAKLLAIYEDESLATLPLPVRVSYRARALSVCLQFERLLMWGQPQTDEDVLALVREETGSLRRRRA